MEIVDEYVAPDYKPRVELDYRNKVILAPMVRVGTLPMRLLAKRWGADICYGEEIVDRAIMNATRIVDEVHGTVDFVKPDGTKVYRTNAEDTPNVFQLGTANAINALKVGELVSRDVVGIDLNMGCPKHFSVHAGMGSALLNKPETVADILKTLVRNLNNPITCKVRLKKTTAETVDLLKMVEQCGVKAVTVHARYVHDRPRDKARWPLLREITDLKPISVPIIANGDVFVYDDIAKCRAATGADSVMIARGASYNVTAAFSQSPLPFEDVMREYVKVAVDVDQFWSNAKYNLLYMAKDTNQWLAKTERGRAIHTSKKFEDIIAALDLMDYYEAAKKKFELRRIQLGLGKEAEKHAPGMAQEVQSDEAEIERVLSRATVQKSLVNPNVGDAEVQEPPHKKAKIDPEVEESFCGTERS